MNVTDDDGDTPMYVVENIETARYLVEHGAEVDRRNAEGVSVCLSCRDWRMARVSLLSRGW